MNTTFIKSILFSLIMILPVCGEDSVEAENAARKYFKAFGDQDWPVLVSLMHPKVLENLKPNILQLVPKTAREIVQENKEDVDDVIKMLKVDSPEAAWALPPSELYLRMMTHMSTTQTLKVMKQAVNEILDVKVKGEGMEFTVDLHAVSTLGDERFEGFTHLNLEKLDGKFYVVSMTKTRIPPEKK